MPNVAITLPAVGEDPYGQKLLNAIIGLRDAINNANGTTPPLPLGPVAVAGDVSGPTAAATHVHPTTGMATLADLEAAVIGAGGVPVTRTIAAGTGLTGGGTLEQDRTVSVVFGTSAGTVVEGNDPRIGGAVVGATTADSVDDYVLTIRLTGDLVHRYGIRADGSIDHGGPPVAVSGVTGTTTVTVTTAANHNLGTGDVVTIAGIQSYTGANGTFTITRTGDTTFTLDTTTGSGTYTTGGTVQRVLGSTGSDLEGAWNAASDGVRDLVVLRGHVSGTGHILLVRDHLGQPVFAVPQFGGPAVMGDDLRVFAGGDINNSEVNLRSDGTVRVRKGDPGSGVGVLAVGNATTAPTANPDGSHTVNGASTVAGGVLWISDGRPHVRTSAGHVDELLAPGRRRAASLSAPGGDVTLLADGTLPPTVATANVTASSDDQAAGPLVKYLTAASSGVDAGVLSSFGTVQRRWAPYLSARVQTDASAVTSTRLAIGLTSAEIGGGAGPASSGSYSTAAGAWLRYDSGVDGTAFWRAVTADGSSATVTTTTTAIAADTSYELAVEVDAAGTAVRFWANGVLVATHTANLPGASTALAPIARLRTLAASARALRLGRLAWSQL